jgi:OmpA-OmpF porin, OOP family
MGPGSKILLGASAIALLGALTHGVTCGSSAYANGATTMAVGTATEGAATAIATPAVEPATKEAVASCQTDINSLMTGKAVNFQSGSAYLAPESSKLLADVAKALKPCTGTQVEVQGHTDLIGNADINQNLSQARAETVVKALVDQGIPAAQLTAKGYGLTQPLENARTPQANAKNRRTVFAVTAAGVAPTVTPAGGQ